jgi:hypothetical protein
VKLADQLRELADKVEAAEKAEYRNPTSAAFAVIVQAELLVDRPDMCNCAWKLKGAVDRYRKAINPEPKHEETCMGVGSAVGPWCDRCADRMN